MMKRLSAGLSSIAFFTASLGFLWLMVSMVTPFVSNYEPNIYIRYFELGMAIIIFVFAVVKLVQGFGKAWEK